MNYAEYEKLLIELMEIQRIKKTSIPKRLTDGGTDRLLKIYSDVYSKLFSELHAALLTDLGISAQPTYQTQLKLLTMIEGKIKALDEVVYVQIKEELSKQFLIGTTLQTLADTTVKSLEQLKGLVPFSILDSYKMTAIVEDTFEDLLFATQHTKKELKKLVRETFAKNIQYWGLKGENYTNIKRIIEKELSAAGLSKTLKDKGFIGIVDKSGKRWNLKTYVDMAVQTKMKQAYAEGLKDRAVETGWDLAKISENGATDSCKYFEGMLISMNGLTKGYMTYDQLKATNLIFHPRCRHTPIPIGNPDLYPEEDMKFHEQQMKNLKNKIKTSK